MHRTMGTVRQRMRLFTETLRHDSVRQNCRRRDQFPNVCGDAGHRKFALGREREKCLFGLKGSMSQGDNDRQMV